MFIILFWSSYIVLYTFGIILFFHWLSKSKNLKKFKISEWNAQITFNEVRNTVVNVLLFGVVFGFLGYLIDRGLTKVYFEINWSLSEIGYLVLSLILALLIHDVYFYLSHRFLHLKPIYKFIHRFHHQSVHPTVFAAFSFHPVEGIIQIGAVILVALILPIHAGILLFFVSFLIFMSVYGHTGYEFRANKLKTLQVFNTSIHHYQHHTTFDYNFGIYLNIWDKLLKTNHPDYEMNVEEFKLKGNNKN